MRKIKIIILFSVFCFLFSLVQADDMGSSKYKISFISVGANVNSTASSKNIFTYFVMGQEFAVPVEIDSSDLLVSFGEGYYFPSLVGEVKYEIAELGAKTNIGGFEIRPETWQKDNDPYFYWLVFLNPPTLIRGFSVSLDEPPDEVIDTTSASYQYSADALSDGAHTFYVMPSVSEDTWGPPIGFDIWVDTTPPSISELLPSAGALVSEKDIELSCRIKDITSGLDSESLEFIFNEESIFGDFDEEEELFFYKASLEDGENIVLVKAEDITGNQAVKSWSFIIDATPPACSMVINNDDPITNSAYAVLKITVEDELSGVKYIYISNDGIFDTEMEEPFKFTPIVDNWVLRNPDISGKKTVYVRFEDNAGNVSGIYSDEIDLIVTVPDTRIISAPSSLTSDKDATFYYEASREGSLFSYSLDGSVWSVWQEADSISFSGLDLGSHLFRVKAGFDADNSGSIAQDEEDPTPAQWSWTVKEETLIERLQRTLFFRRR
ncbi:MAG: hypothetical protein JW734_05010 [Candidatus Omnitrophica bacterium]|nr:hypothetical protein [Candidatus Omnitrophota bacterium]